MDDATRRLLRRCGGGGPHDGERLGAGVGGVDTDGHLDVFSVVVERRAFELGPRHEGRQRIVLDELDRGGCEGRLPMRVGSLHLRSVFRSVASTRNRRVCAESVERRRDDSSQRRAAVRDVASEESVAGVGAATRQRGALCRRHGHRRHRRGDDARLFLFSR